MTETHRTAPCPICGTMVSRLRVFFWERELYADTPCLCHSCHDAHLREEAAKKAAYSFRAHWEKHVPADYQKAMADQVPPYYRPALRWQPSPGCNGVGIHGPSGSGKTHALALLALSLAIPFRWVTGARMRQLAIDAATLDGPAREDARKDLAALRDVPLLVIDDLAEVRFTEAWADKLFEVLEHRNGSRRLTCWTAQHGPGQLAAKISGGKDVDAGTGNAIERRLCQHHQIFSA